jgi:type II secretory pathway pseudopilin PulG
MELMIVVALIAIITPSITYLFLKMSQGMAGDEMRSQLQALNEQTMMRVHERVEATRHLFMDDLYYNTSTATTMSSGLSFIAAVTLGMAATTKANYPIVTGAQLAQCQPIATVTNTAGSFSPASGTAADYGNCLLFGAYDSPQTIPGVTVVYRAPVTVQGAAITYSGTTNAGMPATVTVDLYRFYFYYLTSANPRPLSSTTSYRLIEWQSVQYADFFEISDISDGALKTSVVTWLATPGNPDPSITNYAVTLAWDPTQTDIRAAFYTLATTGATTPLTAVSAGGNITIPEAYSQALTRVSSGLLSNGFGYGISPNSANWSSSPVSVPLFATANGNFPGGFEVGISGSAAGREVLTRMVLVGQGATPKIQYNEDTMVHNVRDVW